MAHPTTARAKPSNRRRVYLVSLFAAAGWELAAFGIASIPDTNCAVEDCDVALGVLIWAVLLPLPVLPVVAGYRLRSAIPLARTVKFITAVCSTGAALVAAAAFAIVDAELSGPSSPATTEALAGFLIIFFVLPLALPIAYVLVGLGNAWRRNRDARLRPSSATQPAAR